MQQRLTHAAMLLLTHRLEVLARTRLLAGRSYFVVTRCRTAGPATTGDPRARRPSATKRIHSDDLAAPAAQRQRNKRKRSNEEASTSLEDVASTTDRGETE
jgi:hypothetical protein